MTLEEKFWQLFMIPATRRPAHDYSHGVFGLQIAPTPAAPDGKPAWRAPTAERINAIQRYFVERHALGIPIIPFEEALHGLVARRDDVSAGHRARGHVGHALVRRGGAAIARETRARGIRQVLVARDQHRERRAMGPRRGDVR
jgi:beta-glucosidase